jgi:hypothetical protein
MPTSDFNFFSDGKRVIDLNSEVSHRTLDLGVPEQKLHRAQVARPAVDQNRLRASERVGAEDICVKPDASLIHSETRRAYCRVVIPCSGGRCLVNRNSPGFLPAAFRYASTAWRVCSLNSKRTGRPVFFWRTVAHTRSEQHLRP